MASIYDKQILSKNDLDRIIELGNAWMSTKDKNVRAGLHQQAEAIRNSYGYSGGVDGGQFIIQNTEVLNTANAGKAYTNALENAASVQNASYDAMATQIERNKDDRLREAYIKNMQDSLGLEQQLKSAGISGGATESTRAYMNNVYNTGRNDIKTDAQTAQSEVDINRANANAKSLAEIAKAEYDSAKERNSSLRYAEQTAYDRSMDEYKKQIDERDFNYQKQIDERDFNYNKAVDERDFNYNKAVDERDFNYNKAVDQRDFNYNKAVDERDFNYNKAVDQRDFNYNKAIDQRDFNYNKAVDQRDFNYNKAIDQRDFNYNKAVDQRDFNYNKAVDQRDFNYNKAVDERDFNYNKQVDERDFNYTSQNDEKNRQATAKKSASSSSSSSGNSKMTPTSVISLIKAGVYNPEFSEILGITDDEVRDMVENYKSEEAKSAAWKLMANGIYDDSFPELVGFSEDVLKNYVNSVLNGF